MNLIGDDYFIQYEIGTDAFLGGAPGAFGSPVTITTNGSATFDRASWDGDIQTVPVKGGGDRKARNRYHTEAEKAEITGLVSSELGFQFLDWKGYYIRITFRPHSVLLPERIIIGVITSVTAEAQQGQAQTERASIDLNPDIEGA